MTRARTWCVLGLAVAASGWLMAVIPAHGADDPVRLWPETAPGDRGGLPPEKDLTKPDEGLIAGRRLIRLGNVSEPTLQVYRSRPGAAGRPAVLVCPGGGYHILAMDLEGTEVCEWLNSLGITGVLLKYRVPRREGREVHEAPLQDAQRAMSLIRQNATAWGIDPGRVGVLGFSAGGHLSAALSTATERTYPVTDAADAQSFRPNFTVLVYPGYLVQENALDQVRPELKVGTNTPPTFLVMTQDDPVKVENVLVYSAALHRAGVPFQLHVFPKGGHGYGLRRTRDAVTGWTDLAAAWFEAGGWMGSAAR